MLGSVAVLIGAVALTYLNAAPRRPPVESPRHPVPRVPRQRILHRRAEQASVLQLFGSLCRNGQGAGLRWANPFYSKRKLSLRVRNFESAHLKVNDANANPIEIASVIVWRVVETAEAVFEVDDYENYVKVQTEAAVRNLATSYPYDSHDAAILSLMATAGRWRNT
jgi:hypothetical protein